MSCSQAAASSRSASVPRDGLRVRARAATPKRLVVVFTPNGVIHENWVPTGGERDFRLGRSLAPLEPHRDDIIVLDGVDNAVAQEGGPGDDHLRARIRLHLVSRQFEYRVCLGM